MSDENRNTSDDQINNDAEGKPIEEENDDIGKSSKDQEIDEKENKAPDNWFESIKKGKAATNLGSDKSNDNSTDDYKDLLKEVLKHMQSGSFGSVNYYGGIHVKDSNVHANNSNFVGNDQFNSSSGIPNNEVGKSDDAESIEDVFDSQNNIEDCSFMIALAILDGSSYHAVLEASQKLASTIHLTKREPQDASH